MGRNGGQLTTLDFIALISSTMLGVGLLVLPRTITAKVGTPDGWLVLIIDGLLFFAIIYILLQILKKHNVKNYFDYTQEGFGKKLGKLVNLIMVVYFVGVASFEVVAMSEMVRFFLLAETPVELIILTFILTSAYLINSNLKVIARVCVFFFPITIAVILLIYAFGLQIVDIKNVQPVLGQGIMPVVKGMNTVMLSFFGIELLLILKGFTSKDTKLMKGAFVGFAVPLLLYILTYVLVVGGVTVQEVTTVTWPTISFVQSFEVKGIFIERLESFLLITWILQFFTTLTLYYFSAVTGLQSVFRNGYKPNIYILVPIIFLLANWPKDTIEILKMSDVLGWIFPFILLAIPIINFLLVAIKRRVKAR
ncbi:spore germination protein [Bacillus sp. JZ8]